MVELRVTERSSAGERLGHISEGVNGGYPHTENPPSESSAPLQRAHHYQEKQNVVG